MKTIEKAEDTGATNALDINEKKRLGASLDDLIFGKTGSYSEFDIRNRLLRQIDGMNVRQVEFIEEQIALMKKLFEA